MCSLCAVKCKLFASFLKHTAFILQLILTNLSSHRHLFYSEESAFFTIGLFDQTLIQLWSHYSEGLLQKLLGLSRCCLAYLNQPFLQHGHNTSFLLATRPCRSFVFKYSLIVYLETTTPFSRAACITLEVVCGFFFASRTILLADMAKIYLT